MAFAGEVLIDKIKQLVFHEVGTTIFVPGIVEKSEAEECPDCKGEHKWAVKTGGNEFSVTCPRCRGGEHYLLPRRRVLSFEIKEAKVVGSVLRIDEANGEARLHCSYNCEPYIGEMNHDKVFLNKEDAEYQGAVMVAERTAKLTSEWDVSRQRDNQRAGQEIVHMLNERANAKFSDLKSNVETLKELMLKAISYPSLYGPQLKRSYTGDPLELTQETLSEWLSDLLEKSDLESWSESELHEAMCSCG